MTRDLERLLSSKAKALRVIYVSSYIPRRCGIATYTKDLTNAINLLNPYALAEILAVNRPGEALDYPWEVKIKIDQANPDSYRQAAEYINQSGADLVCLEHEFGLFGGQKGKYILPFVESLQLPLVTTLHTIVDDTTGEYGLLLEKIIAQSEAVVVMMKQIKEKLVREYKIPAQKVIVIPHGTPDLPLAENEKFKKRKNVANRLVLGNINLLHPVKGIEYALEAVALIAKNYPNVLYLVIGETHPVYKEETGETYRNNLKKLVKKLKIEKNVRFVNEYLTLDEVVDWLRVIDFYITPYLDQDQAASGALAYALGTGKCCISTPFVYAKEVLAEGRGRLVPFKNPEAIARTVIELWENPRLKHSLEKKAYAYGRLMTWTSVALQYLNLFHLVLRNDESYESARM